MDDALDGVHVILQFGDLTNEESEGLLDADDVTERDAGLGRGDGEPGGDGEDGNDEGEEDTEHIDSDAQPTLIRDCQPVSPETERSEPCTPSDRGRKKPILDVHPILALPSEPFSLAIRSDRSQTSERLRKMSIQRRP